jgi:DNA (cytosine-5)-methyltransferase 1
LNYKVLNTKDFWLPQNRERVFIVWSYAWINAIPTFNFPQWQELTIFLKDILEEEVDEKYFLSDEKTQELIYKDTESKVVTNVNPSWRWMNGNVYRTDTTAPTLTTNKWEGIKIVNATKKWYIEWFEWDGIVLY